MHRVLLFVSLCAVLSLSGCPSGKPPTSPQTSTPKAVEITAAERVVDQIERARIARNWPEVNRRLSVVAYQPAQRNATPAFPFAEIGQKLGDLKSFDFVVSLGSADYHDPATGSSYPKVIVHLKESYGSATAAPVEMEFTMLKEEGQWRLAGVRASQARR